MPNPFILSSVDGNLITVKSYFSNFRNACVLFTCISIYIFKTDLAPLKWKSWHEREKYTWEEPLTSFCNMETESKFLFILVGCWEEGLSKFRSCMGQVQGSAEWVKVSRVVCSLVSGRASVSWRLSQRPPSLLLALAIPLTGWTTAPLGRSHTLYMHTHTPTQTHTSTLLHKYCANKVSLRVYVPDFYKRDL